jgi:hypothetical protein
LNSDLLIKKTLFKLHASRPADFSQIQISYRLIIPPKRFWKKKEPQMKKIVVIIILILFALILLGGSCALYHIRDRHSGYQLNLRLPEKADSTGQFQVGLAKASITPPLEDTWVDADSNARYEPSKGDSYVDKNQNGKFDAYWLAGFSQNRPAAGVHDEIWARAVVFDDGQIRLALVVLDAIGIFHDDVITIREMVAAKNLPVDHVIVAATHVHEVPDLMGLWGPKFYKSGVNPDYMKFVQEQTVSAIEQALQQRQPAYLQLLRLDSTAADLVRDSRPPKVLDDALHLMQFRSTQNDSLLGLLMNWGNHPETVDSENLFITADFPHYWIKGLEEGIVYDGELKRPGIGGTVIFANGAVGGLMTSLGSKIYDPWLQQHFKKSSFEKVRAQGNRLADLVLNAVEQQAWERIAHPTMTLRAKTFTFKVQNTMFRIGGMLGVFNRGFVGLNKMRSEINLVTLGDVWLLTVPCELNPEIANGGVEAPEGRDFADEIIEAPPFRKLMRGKYNFILGLANDEVGYVMPRSHWDAKAPYTYGNKKAFYGEVNSLGPDAGPTLYREVQRLISE